MTEPTPHKPTLRDRTRPAELLGLSAVLAGVTGVVTYFGTRDFLLAVEFTGIAFIVSLVVFAMLMVAISPQRGNEERRDEDGRGHP